VHSCRANPEHGRTIPLADVREPASISPVQTRYGTSDLPNLVRQLLQVWSYRLAHPDYLSKCWKLDCGMVFDTPLPASWIDNITFVDDDELSTSLS
jgi:hypothetical protein